MCLVRGCTEHGKIEIHCKGQGCGREQPNEGGGYDV